MVISQFKIVSRSDMDRAFEAFTAELNIRQGEVRERILRIENTITGMDQKINILDSHVSARMQTVEEHLTGAIEKIPDMEKDVREAGVKNKIMETAMEEVQEQMVNVATAAAQEVTNAPRKCEELVEEAQRVNGVLTEADKCVRNLNMRMEAVEKNKDKNTQNHRGLLDPKHMNVTVFDGKGKEKFADWRETMDKMVNEVHQGLMHVLNSIRTDKTRITEARISEFIADLEIDGETIKVDYKWINYELGAYLLTKLDDQPKRKAESVKVAGGFEMYRTLSQRYDRVTEDHEALLTSEISKMAASQAANLRDLGNKLLTLEAKIEAYQLKLGKETEPTLLGSVLTAMLDLQTRREFLNKGGILRNYELMREKIDELSGNCGGPTAMDIGNVDMYVCQPCEPPQPQPLNIQAPNAQAPFNQAPDLAEVGQKPPNPNIQCWTCNEKGHISRNCPMNQKGAKGSKGGSKGNPGWQNQNKGGGKGKGWQQKRFGKGGKGTKGKGAYSLEQAECDWWDERWFGEDDGGLPTLATLATNGDRGAEKEVRGKYYANLGMYIDYDSDDEDRGLPPISSEEHHDYMDHLVTQSDDSDYEDSHDELEEFPALPGAETLEGTERIMQGAWARSSMTQEQNDKILNGTHDIQRNDEELKAR